MKLNIDTPAGMIAFVKRDDVTAADAIAVFGSSFKVLCVTLTDAVSGEVQLDKADVIQKIESFINAGEIVGGADTSVLLF
jgi:hypothetical protein